MGFLAIKGLLDQRQRSGLSQLMMVHTCWSNLPDSTKHNNKMHRYICGISCRRLRGHSAPDHVSFN